MRRATSHRGRSALYDTSNNGDGSTVDVAGECRRGRCECSSVFARMTKEVVAMHIRERVMFDTAGVNAFRTIVCRDFAWGCSHRNGYGGGYIEVCDREEYYVKLSESHDDG